MSTVLHLYRPLLLLLACGLLLVGVDAAAQLEAQPLTFERALELAADRNETRAIGRARMRRAAALTREAWGRLLPQALLQASYARRSNAVEREVGGTSTIIQSANAFGATGSLETRLLDAPAIPLVNRARANQRAAEHEAHFLEQSLAFDVASAFYAVLSAEELHAAARKRVEVAEEGVTVASRRLAAGLVGKQELTRTQLELSNARVALTDAQLLVGTTRLALGELLAATIDMPLAEPTPPTSEGSPPSAAQAAERPDLLALESSVRAAEHAALEPWLRLVPSLDIGAQVRTTNEPGLSGVPTTWNLFAAATWVLYDGGVLYANAAARRAEAEELKLNLASLRRSVDRQHEEASLRIIASREALSEARTAARIARENASEVERLFAAGLATALERADANASAYEAEAEQARKLFALRVAQLEERRARGLWPTGEQP